MFLRLDKIKIVTHAISNMSNYPNNNNTNNQFNTQMDWLR